MTTVVPDMTVVLVSTGAGVETTGSEEEPAGGLDNAAEVGVDAVPVLDGRVDEGGSAFVGGGEESLFVGDVCVDIGACEGETMMGGCVTVKDDTAGEDDSSVLVEDVSGWVGAIGVGFSGATADWKV